LSSLCKNVRGKKSAVKEGKIRTAQQNELRHGARKKKIQFEMGLGSICCLRAEARVNNQATSSETVLEKVVL
jgi:hypothetical protein